MSLLDAAGVVTGDIWCTGAFSFESPLKDLLDSGEYTLEQLLAEDELLQELRGIHPQLIEFFSTEEAVTRLIQYVILPPGAPPPNAELLGMLESSDNPDGGSDEAQEVSGEDNEDPATQTDRTSQQDQIDMVYVRFPYMACEVICCEMNGIIDTLVDGFVPTAEEPVESVVSSDGGEQAEVTLKDARPQTILDLLFSLLYDSKPGEIDDYRAGYFDKLLSVLFRKRPQAMSQYVNEGGGRGNLALMKAMCNHLYSHSIMQIVQRLLLPQVPLGPSIEDDPEKVGEDLYADALEGAGDVDGMGGFRCNWSDSLESLDLLLDCLIGTDPIQSQDGEEQPSQEELDLEQERTLSLCQNASEVLITIIQNSPLTSPTLNTLTTDPVIEKLIIAASSHDENSDFSPHDSKLTCTMNVLESLILQLGGYGSVGTVVLPEDEEDNEEDLEGVEVQDGVPPTQHDQRQELATSATLISHLPMMLSSLCNLLLHPSAEKWVSPMQFSKSEPQKLLGSSRLRIVRLLESLVLLGDPSVDSLLCESNCLEICLDLFWKFQWCSMLHQSVANLLVHVFEGANSRSELQSYFMVKCNLLGRLMDSFWEANEDGNGSEARLSEAVMAMKNIDVPTSSVGSERGSLNSNDSAGAGDENKDDVIPVSDDDVDAALEQQESEIDADDEEKNNKEIDSSESENEANVAEQVNGETSVSESQHSSLRAMPDGAPAQSFRLGYMGHVIIICQALVHACTNEVEMGDAPSMAEGGSLAGMSSGEPRMGQEGNGELGQFVDDPDSQPQEGVALHDALERGRTADSVVTEETPQNPLILAQLVETHPLRSRWQEFVTTTLASETAIQSTPLGGFHVSPGGMDPLHAHRPGLADEGEYVDDDGAAPPLPPRGLLVGGDVIDMDDNDLDIAASMMAGLTLGRAAVEEAENQAEGSPDLLSGVPPQQEETAPAGTYMFDDPLGEGRFNKFDQENEDDSSSDEEDGTTNHSGDSGNAVVEGVSYSNPPNNDSSAGDQDVPVMDLFAGNFDTFGDNKEGGGGDSAQPEQGTWSNFANFDDAFAAGQGGPPPAQDKSDDKEPEVPSSTPNGDVEAIFGHAKDHAILLDEKNTEEKPVDESGEETKGESAEAEPVEENQGEVVNAEISEGTTVSD